MARQLRGRGRVVLAIAGGALSLFGAACDGGAPAVDASAAPTARTSAVSLRFDVRPERAPTLTVLAFRAAMLGVAPADVLGIVDPLAAAPPAQDCQVRDVGHTVATLVAQGRAIELEELEGVEVSIGDGGPDIRASARLYPDVAATVGGVVAAVGPISLSAVPEGLWVSSRPPGVAATAPSDAAAVTPPSAGWIRLLNGAVPRDGSRVETAQDLGLMLAIGDAATTILELRPLGATVALACAILASKATPGGELQVTVPRQALADLMATLDPAPGLPVAASLDLVRRSSDALPLSRSGIAVEVRTSTVVELRP